MKLISKRPVAIARMQGGVGNTGFRGVVRFYQFLGGMLVEVDVCGLPDNGVGFYGLHIHEGGECSGTDFSSAGSHLGGNFTPHPRHAGDLPPLLSYNGRAYLAVMSDRFSLTDILGRTVVIHGKPDDFHTQPAGNAGQRIACGAICRA